MDGRPALIVAPYDAELFGHWWFEGPDWINFLLRKTCYDQDTVKTITVPEYLDRHPRVQVAQPTMSSWGYKGYNEVWLEGSNDWIYRHLHEGADRMVELARNNPAPDALRRRALNQAARELLQGSGANRARRRTTRSLKAGYPHAITRPRLSIGTSPTGSYCTFCISTALRRVSPRSGLGHPGVSVFTPVPAGVSV